MATKDLSQPRAIDSACFATGKRIGRGRGTHAEPILQQGDAEHILGGLVRQRGTRSTASIFHWAKSNRPTSAMTQVPIAK